MLISRLMASTAPEAMSGSHGVGGAGGGVGGDGGSDAKLLEKLLLDGLGMQQAAAGGDASRLPSRR